ncbi:MAG: helicase-related protein [Acidithiobacillus ferrivorans]
MAHAGHLQTLISEAERLSGQAGDPKLAVLIQHLHALLKEGFHPVVFCRYIATAHYVADHLKQTFPKAVIDAVTGEYTPEERRERVEALAEGESRVLVATDCLSEGINLGAGPRICPPRRPPPRARGGPRCRPVQRQRLPAVDVIGVYVLLPDALQCTL